MNAISHAYKPKDKGTIKIKIQKKNDKIEIIFTDDGCGMNENTLSKIFEPFFTTRRDIGGTGLGLSVVYSIVVQQFFGTILCKSKLGIGTTFSILLSEGGATCKTQNL